MASQSEPQGRLAFLRLIRRSAEIGHRRDIKQSWSHFPFILTPTLPLPFIHWDKLQDLCNKSVGIYWTKPRPGIRHNPEFLEQFIYDTWARGKIHKRDLEFGRYVAKLVMLGWPDRLASTDEVLDVHRALIERYEETKPKIPLIEDDDRYHLQYHGYINKQQSEYFNIRPLFRALIIILEKPNFSDAPNQDVLLVRTGVEDGLSAPIDFETLAGKGNDSVTVTLQTALRFVIQLDERESAAFPDTENSLACDRRHGNREQLAKLIGYTGPEVIGPSTGWIEDDE
ncbi:hypothetical protein DL95DRAFT_517257 [Leptodontidium sp. 2 PMI_412]|nr:hypothetical protein DL95DRAFT_517257 [Leptodontidium sp. 2 PMI_412]